MASVKVRPLTASSLRLTLRPPCDNGATITSYVCELSTTSSSDGVATRHISVTPDAPPTPVPVATPSSLTGDTDNEDQQTQDDQKALVVPVPVIPTSSSHVSLTLEDLLSETVYKLVFYS